MNKEHRDLLIKRGRELAAALVGPDADRVVHERLFEMNPNELALLFARIMREPARRKK